MTQVQVAGSSAALPHDSAALPRDLPIGRPRA